jgi:hypothetical protein
MKSKVASRSVPFCFMLLFMLFGICPLHAQIGTASVSGTLKDNGGAAIPGANVILKDTDTGSARITNSDSKGFYSFAGLGTGNYSVGVDKTGFAHEEKSGFHVDVNQQASVDFTLGVAAVASTVQVNAAAVALDTGSSTVSGLVGSREIGILPLNGRDYTQLALLQPGVSSMATAGANPLATGGGIAKYSVNGIRPTGNDFLLDGQDSNDPSFNIPAGGVSGQALGQDAIAEYSLMTSTYTAEYGRNAGAVLNAVSRSGTNQFHGSAYEFIRNSALDARNYFNPGALPPFKRNDFGGTFGGPIQRDKTFFFFNYEGFRERLGVTDVATVPNARARTGVVPVTTNGVTTLTNVGVAPGVATYLNLFPLPNGADNGDGTAQYSGYGNQPTNENYYLARVDHQFSSKDSVFGRYNFDTSKATVPFANTTVPGFPEALNRQNTFATLQYQHIFSPHLLNNFSASYGRLSYYSDAGTPTNLSISLVPGNTYLGAIAITGLGGLGYSSSADIGATSNIFDYADGLSWEKGNHILKFGTEIKRYQINSFYNGQTLGAYSLGGLVPFLQGKSLTYTGVTAGSTSQRSWRQWATAFYAQDDYHVTDSLTLNGGLRYEYDTVPYDIHGRNTNLRNPATDKTITVGQPLYVNPTDTNFAPRVGFAYSPAADQHRTVIRGGYGIFYDFIWENLYGNTRFTPPFFTILLTANAPFPTPPASGTGVISPQIMVYKPSNPFAMQYNLNVERAIGGNFIATVGYIASKGTHLFRVVEANPNKPVIQSNGQLFFPTTATRINPAFGPIRDRFTDAYSNYNSLQASLKREFSNGLRLQASYTYSKSLDDSSGPFQTDTVSQPANTMNPYNPAQDYAPSSFDVRNVIVVNYTYELPFGRKGMFAKNVPTAVDKVIGGWILNGIDSFTTGHPFTITEGSNISNSGENGTGIADRPNLTPGFSNNPIHGTSAGCAGVTGGKLGGPNLYFDPCAFSLQPAGYFGNLGRNTLFGPHYADFDLSLIKTTPITERVSFEFRGEFFNIFNHTNFQVPSNAGTTAGATSGGDFAFGSTGARVGNAGKIFATVGTSRQIQFAGKIVF